jgi:hypothetical protein
MMGRNQSQQQQQQQQAQKPGDVKSEENMVPCGAVQAVHGPAHSAAVLSLLFAVADCHF